MVLRAAGQVEDMQGQLASLETQTLGQLKAEKVAKDATDSAQLTALTTKINALQAELAAEIAAHREAVG